MNATLADVRRSSIPEAIGLCQTDLPRIANAVNEATQQLIYAGGAQGFYGTWRKVALSATVTNPYITLGRQFARIINLDICRTPIRIRNQFFEYLPGGIGLQEPWTLPDWCGNLQGYERNNVATITDLPTTNPQYLRVYITDNRDVNLRILITGLDQNGHEIYSTDGLNNVKGFFLTFAQPFSTSSFTVSEIQFVQKDITFGDVVLKAVDSVTGAETTLSRYAPTETNPSYRRYLITSLPTGCCCNSDGTLSITGIVKMEYQPVYQDTDQLIIANLPALKYECLANRYATMDVPNAAVLEVKNHRKAIRLLQDEMRHMEGEQEPSVVVNPFGAAALINQRIGYIV